MIPSAWWEEPDALLRPLTGRAVERSLAQGGQVEARRTAEDTWVLSLWHLPLRLRLVAGPQESPARAGAGGALLHAEALHLPTAPIADPVALRRRVLADRRAISNVIVERGAAGPLLRSSSWMPLLAGAAPAPARPGPGGLPGIDGGQPQAPRHGPGAARGRGGRRRRRGRVGLAEL